MTTPVALDEYPKTVVLADGTHLVLRPLGPPDDAGVERLLARVPVAESAAWRGLATALRIGAFEGNRLAAVLALRAPASRTEEETGELAVLLHPDYRGRRLGTWLLLDAVHLAAGLGIDQLIARAADGDGAYRAALRRLDFVEAPSAGAGVLVKTLHGAWTDF